MGQATAQLTLNIRRGNLLSVVRLTGSAIHVGWLSCCHLSCCSLFYTSRRNCYSLDDNSDCLVSVFFFEKCACIKKNADGQKTRILRNAAKISETFFATNVSQ
jgi:hypothetical protein